MNDIDDQERFAERNWVEDLKRSGKRNSSHGFYKSRWIGHCRISARLQWFPFLAYMASPTLDHVSDIDEPLDKKANPIKVMSVGNADVGKSWVFSRCCHSILPDVKIAVCQVSTKALRIGNETVGVMMIDPPKNLVPMEMGTSRDPQVVYLMYDITNMSSFRAIREWKKLCNENLIGEPLILLVGNKKDEESKRQISTREAQRLANDLNMPFIECSAKTGENIDALYRITALWGHSG
eukprot:TRINITY_DN5244_c0_g1_i1.p2 TRINITY_DN5244_c0_g1~~TRINITY_DN5244_c0_g1_i1.p2  ORF type:complete len:237 (-),score=50.25 TRINITY_DN5244_c0_g1_i1:101-811(-)